MLDASLEELVIHLKKFVCEARRYRYITGEPQEKEDGSKTISFSKGELTYQDTWRGDRKFGGEEVISREGKCIWHMVYHGGVTDEFPPPGLTKNEFFTFLYKALGNPPSHNPLRGPEELTEGSLTYKNIVTRGDFEDFHGHEVILYGGEPIYYAEYSGGLLL